MTTTPGSRLSGLLAVTTLALAVFIFVLGAATQALGEPGTAVSDVLTRMKTAYKDQPAVQATFVQTNSGASYFEPLVMKGTLALKKPRRVRMEYTTPRAKTFLSDGSTLWVIDQGDRTVTRSRTQVEAVGTMFDFLTGAGDVTKDFVVTVATGEEAVDGLDVLRLEPKAPGGGLASVFVHVHPTSGFVQGVITTTPFGDRSETALSEIRTDVQLPDEGFVYASRDGFTIVDVD